MKTKILDHTDGIIQFKSYISYPDDLKTKKPAVLIFPDWSGRTVFSDRLADDIAQLGYIGFSVDPYGNGTAAQDIEQKRILMTPLIENRLLLKQRILSAFEMLSHLDCVDPDRIAAIGFCFGGLCALDLVRHGTHIAACVSFHGLLTPLPQGMTIQNTRSKILVLHGYRDPMVPPNELFEFMQEMNTAKIDWQVHTYGQAMHAFTNPLAQDGASGIEYHPISTQRAFHAMKSFFSEVF